MKYYIAFLIVSFLSVSGCNKKDSTAVTSDEVNETLRAVVDSTEERQYLNIEYCIINHAAGGKSSTIGSIPEGALSVGGKASFSRTSGDVSYSLGVSFVGRRNKADLYAVEIEAPGFTPKSFETEYVGNELELFKDDECVISLRPGAAKPRT